MASWKKLINSGSDAHVESLEILSPPTLSPSLEVDGGVFFYNLPDQDPDLPEGTLMKIEDGGGSSIFEGVGNSKFVIISNNSETIEGIDDDDDDVVFSITYYKIPWNAAYMDTNEDGEIGSADLLDFLIAYGSLNTVVGNNNFDSNGDGEVGSADLLEFLIAYGETLDVMNSNGTLPILGDERPNIIWHHNDFDWIDDDPNSDTYGYVTADSVRTYYETFTDPFAIDGFWSKLGYNPDDAEGYGNYPWVYQHIFNSNPPSYHENTFPYEYIDIFIYIYFTQKSPNTPDWGGSKYYNRDGAVSNYFPDGAPIGYGPYFV
jgi:hypothetical protein